MQFPMHFSCTDVARGARGIMSKGWQASTHMSVSLLGAAVTCCLHQLAEVCAMVGWSDLQPGQQVTQCRCAVDGCGRVFLSEYHRHCCSECVRSQGERHTRRCDQHQQRRAQHYAQDAPATNTWQAPSCLSVCATPACRRTTGLHHRTCCSKCAPTLGHRHSRRCNRLCMSSSTATGTSGAHATLGSSVTSGSVVTSGISGGSRPSSCKGRRSVPCDAVKGRGDTFRVAADTAYGVASTSASSAMTAWNADSSEALQQGERRTSLHGVTQDNFDLDLEAMD